MELSSCGLCQLQIPTPNTLPLDLPIYNSQNQSLKPTPKKLCKSCNILVAQIEQFASHYQIKYCDSHFKSTAADGLKAIVPQPKPAIQLLYSVTADNTHQRPRTNSDSKNKLIPKRLSVGQPTKNQKETEEIVHPYINLVIQEIKNKNLLCLSYLPKTLQLLIHLSTQEKTKHTIISPQERKERIKNIVLFLTDRIHLTLQEIPYVIVLTNFLLCFMEPGKATSIIVRLSDIIITYPNIVSWKTIILDPDMHQSKNPQSPASLDMRNALIKVDKLWLRIQSILQLSKKGQSVLHQGTIRIGKLSIQTYKQYRKKLAQILKPLLTKRQQKEQKNNEDKLVLLYHMKLERNSFSLIIKNMLDYEQDVKQELIFLNGEFRKEKDAYIQKIIKLNTKIQQLENKIAELQENTKKVDTIFENVAISENTASKQVIITERQENIQQKQQKNEDVLLQSVLTLSNLIGFNQYHHCSQKNKQFNIDSSQKLLKIAVQQIQNLQQAYKKSITKLKHSQEQKNRLLAIVSRKDDRFISVITEKDIVIQRYEQALWKMENGLEVQEEPLAHRIRYIKHIFTKQFQKTMQQNEQEQPQQEAKESKEKKQCDIY